MYKLIAILLMLLVSSVSNAYVFDLDEDMNQGIYMFSGNFGASVAETTTSAPTAIFSPTASALGCIALWTEYYTPHYSNNDTMNYLYDEYGTCNIYNVTENTRPVSKTNVVNGESAALYDAKNDCWTTSDSTFNNIFSDADGATLVYVLKHISVGTDYHLGKYPSTSGGWRVANFSSNQEYRFMAFNTGTDLAAGFYNVAGITTNVVIITFKSESRSSTPSMWINGVKQTIASWTTPSATIGPDNTAPLILFNTIDSGTGTVSLDGYNPWLGIYNKILTDAQIISYNNFLIGIYR
jgi:hypothetical protein